jgi:hypothetical protein
MSFSQRALGREKEDSEVAGRKSTPKKEISIKMKQNRRKSQVHYLGDKSRH